MPLGGGRRQAVGRAPRGGLARDRARRGCRPIARSNVCSAAIAFCLSNRIGHRVAHQRRRDLRAEAAMLDDRRGGVARVVAGAKATNREWSRIFQVALVQPPPFAPPWDPRTCAVPVLPAIWTSSSGSLAPAAVPWSTTPAIASRMKSRWSWSTASGAWAGWLAEQPRQDLPPVAIAARHHRQLERIDQHIALADRHVDRVVGLPLAMIFALHPLGVGHGAVALARNGRSNSSPKPIIAPSRRQLSTPARQAHRRRNRCRSSGRRPRAYRPTVALVAVEDVVADRVGAGADHVSLRSMPGLEQRQRHQRLDRRSRRVEALQRPC